jgi:ribosomal-protein-alanine N-acetyltransferase
MSDYLIREMNLEDLPEVLALEREVFPNPWTLEVFEHELRHGPGTLYLVMEEEGQLMGYAGAHVTGSELHITNMAVGESRRREGLGTAMLVSCVRRALATGARFVTLEVRESNHGARSFYRLFGFEELGLMREYYLESGEDAVIMATGDIRMPEYGRLLDALESRAARGEG